MSDNEALQTHYPGCWRDPRHHACAVAHAERLRELVAETIALGCKCPWCERARKKIEG